jgi:YVTN family beta-propeller protein
MFRLSATMLVLGFAGLPGSFHDDAAGPAAYHVIKKIPIGGEGGWDYLTMDSEAHRLYIARSNRVTVVDVEEGKVVGEVPKTPGVHGVALVPSQGRGYSTNGQESTVTVFDLKTLAEVARIKVGRRPDAVVYDPASERVFTMNAGDQDSTAIDVTKNEVVGAVKLGGKPESAVADEKGMIFVNLEDKNEIVAFDAKTLAIKGQYPVSPGAEPVGLAMDRKNRRLFCSCHNQKMVVLDADSGKVIATEPIGKGTDAAAFDQETGLAFSSNGDGTLTVIKAEGDGYKVAANVPTQAGARTMALDTKTHNIYLVTAQAKAAANVGKGARRSFEPGSFVVLVVGQKSNP